MTPARYCEDKTRGAGSSFYYAFLFLPEQKRRAMMALYAFCREVDDIADEVHEQDVAVQKLGFWREEIGRVFDGQPRHPVGMELAWAKLQFDFNKQLFLDILEGMHTDIQRLPIRNDEDLAQYCYRVAGAVGLLSLEVFGYQDKQARHFATTLGEALQLTNILRDLAEDACMGRIYVPQQERIRFEVADQDFKEGLLHQGMQALLAHFGDTAESRFQLAIKLLPEQDRESLRPSLLMAAIYYAHLKRIRAADYDMWRHPVRLLPIHKIWIAWRAWRREKKATAKNEPVRLDF